MLRKKVWTNLQEEAGDFGVLVKLGCNWRSLL